MATQITDYKRTKSIFQFLKSNQSQITKHHLILVLVMHAINPPMYYNSQFVEATLCVLRLLCIFIRC